MAKARAQGAKGHACALSHRTKPSHRAKGFTVMPSRKVVATELAHVLRQISHPDRIRLLLKLQAGEQTVNELGELLAISPTRVSQHLGVLRAVALVETQTRGQQRVYSLAQPELALWLIEGIAFIGHRLSRASALDIENAKLMWQAEGAEPVS
jgi:DNA-binding transcriptional ArsR family regulator